mgnify:CR=1 FL=1|tara:strand:- start:658 stop:987 length:330 start_codon:yes stop_codon:yes gene_type:complete
MENSYRIMTYNKLITEFMGYENIGINDEPMYEYYDNFFQDGSYEVKDLCYHKSWDWLMPVVKAIDGRFGDNDDIDDMINKVHNAVLQFDLLTLYNAVVEVIKALTRKNK